MSFFIFSPSIYLPVDLVVLTLAACTAGLGTTGISEAQTSALCTPDFFWADNQDHQSPCLIAAEIMAPCSGNSYIVPALTNFTHYDLPDDTSANLCSCSWLAYNLLSACDACQGYAGQIVSWAAYSAGCGSFLSTSFYPSSVSLPNDTPIPKWATTDPSTWPNSIFDTDQAKRVADQDQPNVLPPDSKHPATRLPSSTIGAITAGGFALLVLIIIAIWFTHCRCKKGKIWGRATGSASFLNLLNPKPAREPALIQPFTSREIYQTPFINPPVVVPSPSLSGLNLPYMSIDPQHVIVPFDLRNVPSSQRDLSGNTNNARPGGMVVGPVSARRQSIEGQVSMSVQRVPINPPNYDQATSQELPTSGSVHKSLPTTSSQDSQPSRDHGSSSRRTTIDNVDPRPEARATLAAPSAAEGGRVIPLRDIRMDRKQRKRVTLDV